MYIVRRRTYSWGGQEDGSVHVAISLAGDPGSKSDAPTDYIPIHLNQFDASSAPHPNPSTHRPWIENSLMHTMPSFLNAYSYSLKQRKMAR